MTKQAAEMINKEQSIFILKFAGDRIIKKDNELNPNLYDVGYEYEEWNEQLGRFVKKKMNIPQRHQLARIVARTDPEFGKKLAESINYEIPEPELDMPNDES
jgi:hypothetical protein